MNDTVNILESVIISENSKVWPVKSKPSKTHGPVMWAIKPVHLNRNVELRAFTDVPQNAKFSRFLEMNTAKRGQYIVGMFANPIMAPGDEKDVVTIGFIFDLKRARLTYKNHASTGDLDPPF